MIFLQVFGGEVFLICENDRFGFYLNAVKLFRMIRNGSVFALLSFSRTCKLWRVL